MDVSRQLTGLVLVFALSACGGEPASSDVESLAVGFFASRPDSARIEEEVGLSFLPPLVGRPMVAGTFDGNLSPVVHIDRLSPSGSPVGTGKTFTTTTGRPPERIRVDWSAPSYIVNWHTPRYAPGTYRISVLLDERVLGSIEVKLVGPPQRGHHIQGKREAHRLSDFKAGSTIPIKFWLNTCAPVVCIAEDQCHAPGVCNPATALCSNPMVDDGTRCDDGDSCTENDACSSGVCEGGPNTCDTCEPGFDGHYEGVATVQVSWGEVYAPDPPYDLDCNWHTSVSTAAVILDVSTSPSLALTVSLPGHSPAYSERPLDFGRVPWELSPSGTTLTNYWPCAQEVYEDVDLATLTIEPATGAANLNVTCTTAHPDACIFPLNSETIYTMVLPRICP